MIISCTACGKRYNIDGSSIGPSGRLVRCASCGNTWMQEPPGAEPAAPPPVADSAPPDDHGGPAHHDDDHDFPPPPSGIAQPPLGDDDEDIPEPRFRRRAQRPSLDDDSRRRPWLPWAILGAVVVVVLAGAYFGRQMIIGMVPALSVVYEAVGLAPTVVGEGLDIPIEALSIAHEAEGDSSVLVITGEVINIDDAVHQVPALEGLLLDAQGQPLARWVFEARAPSILPGEHVAFETRLVDPDPAAANVQISFTEDMPTPPATEAPANGGAPAATAAQ